MLLLKDELKSKTLFNMLVKLNREIKEKSIKQELPKQDLEVIQSVCSYELDNYIELRNRLIKYYKKAKVDGILALEISVKAETNKTVTEIFMLCIDGCSSNFVSDYIDVKAFWLIELAKQDTWKNLKYVKSLAKELYLIKKLALSTMQGQDVQIRPNFSNIKLDAFKFTKLEEEAIPTVREEVYKYFKNISDIDDSFIIDIKYLVNLMKNLSYTYRRHAVEAFIDNSLKLVHKNLANIFTKAVIYEGLEELSAKNILSDNRGKFYKNKELFTLHLAVRYILDGYAPRNVEEIVRLVYPEIEF